MAKKTYTKAQVQEMIRDAAKKHGVSVSTMMGMAAIESRFDPRAYNKSGASGVYQFMPATWREYGRGKSVWDPKANIDAGARFLKNNIKGLRSVVGREPTVGEVYLAHQQGLAGAKALLANPNKPAWQVLQRFGKGKARVRQNLPSSMRGRHATITAKDFSGHWIGMATRKAAKYSDLPAAPEPVAIAGLPRSAPGLPSLGPSVNGRFSLASGPSGMGRASMDVAGATMGLPRSKGLAYAPSLSAVPVGAVEALGLQDLPTKQVENQSIAKAPALPGAPLGSVERSSLPDLPRKDTRLAMADFDRSFRMGPVSPPKASGRVRGGAGVSASGMASAAVPSGFKAPSVSPRMAEAQSMAALDAIPNAPIDLVGDMQPAFGEVKRPDLQAIDLPKIGATPKPAAPNPYGAFGVPERMMDPNAANLIPQTKLPNAPNPVGVKGAQMLSKMALTGLGATVGGLPGALVGRLAAKALEGRVGDAAGDFFAGGVVGPSGHSYAPGSDIARGVDAMQGGNVGDFWNHTADTPAAGLAYSRERAALEGRPAPKSLFEKMGEDLSKATGGGSSSSGGGTIICSELYRQNLMPAHIWKADEEWGRMIARKDPDIIRGYRYWAAPVVRLMQRSKRATKIIAWLTRPWAYQMAFEVGAVPKGSALGFCTNAIGIPFSWMVGKALKLRKKWRKRKWLGSMIGLKRLLTTPQRAASTLLRAKHHLR